MHLVFIFANIAGYAILECVQVDYWEVKYE